MTRWSATGTHLGPFLVNPPTGKAVQVKAIHIHQIEAGRICRLWEKIDLLGMLQAIGHQHPIELRRMFDLYGRCRN